MKKGKVLSKVMVGALLFVALLAVALLWRHEAGIAASGDEFVFGSAAHAFHPETVDEFVPIFAAQLARYNQIAPALWPNNAVIDQSVVLEDVDTNRLWFIAADGSTRSVSEEETEGLGVSRRSEPDDFSFFEGGMYITVSEQSVRDRLGAEAPHVGAYDSILWLTHEGFHRLEQEEKWIKPEHEEIPNPSREEFLTDIDARAKRDLLQRQLMRAVANPGDETLILDALATYEDYKTQCAADYEGVSYWERIEGTAQYYEAVSSLYVFYPDQVDSEEDLTRALADLARYEEEYVAVGLVRESYKIGLFAGALLDRLDEGWKARVALDPLLTPLEMLSARFKDVPLPQPKQLTPEEIDRVTAKIQERIRFLADRQVSVLTTLRQSVSEMPEEERVFMSLYVDQLTRDFEEMIKMLPEEEQAEWQELIRQ